VLGAAGEPALLHDLPPAALHGLPEASAHAAPSERAAAVPAAAQHLHRHVQRERGPGGPGAVSSEHQGIPETSGAETSGAETSGGETSGGG